MNETSTTDPTAAPLNPTYGWDEATAYLRMCRRSLERLVKRREIGFHKLGRTTLFTGSDLDAYLAHNRVAPMWEELKEKRPARYRGPIPHTRRR